MYPIEEKIMITVFYIGRQNLLKRPTEYATKRNKQQLDSTNKSELLFSDQS